MSPPSSGSGGPYRKPRVDLYTLMLLLSLAAIITGCVFLYFEVDAYGPQPYVLSLDQSVDSPGGYEFASIEDGREPVQAHSPRFKLAPGFKPVSRG